MGHIGPGTFTSAEGIFVLGGYSNGRSRLDHDLFVRSLNYHCHVAIATMLPPK